MVHDLWFMPFAKEKGYGSWCCAHQIIRGKKQKRRIKMRGGITSTLVTYLLAEIFNESWIAFMLNDFSKIPSPLPKITLFLRHASCVKDEFYLLKKKLFSLGFWEEEECECWNENKKKRCFQHVTFICFYILIFLPSNAQEPQALSIRGEHFNQNSFQHSMALFTISERLLK